MKAVAKLHPELTNYLPLCCSGNGLHTALWNFLQARAPSQDGGTIRRTIQAAMSRMPWQMAVANFSWAGGMNSCLRKVHLGTKLRCRQPCSKLWYHSNVSFSTVWTDPSCCAVALHEQTCHWYYHLWRGQARHFDPNDSVCSFYWIITVPLSTWVYEGFLVLSWTISIQSVA